MTPAPIDPAIEEVREARRRISERFGHDPAAIVAYYMELQKKYVERQCGAKKSSDRPDQSAA